jgi:osmotically-inducible protein OsmY
MSRIRYPVAIVALSSVLAGTSAWADAGSTTASSSAKDSNITSRQLATQLLQDVAPGPYGLRVQARNGYVRLSGSVASIRDWMKADEDARNAGAGEVQNNLAVLIR